MAITVIRRTVNSASNDTANPVRSSSIQPKLVNSSNPIHPTLERIFISRGITTVDELNTNVHDLLQQHSLTDIDKAAQRIANAITSSPQQQILIVGDYDADGATSTSVAVSCLRAMGSGSVDFLVPSRFTNGYGLTPQIVDIAQQQYQPDLMITVDNGISSIAGVNAANMAGIDVVVTDHHLAGQELPAACAIVNPNQPNDSFASKNLAGVGVIFYVMLAVRKELQQREWFAQQKIQVPNMASFLDLVALGTVADVVPLDKNNRILVHQGLQRIRAGFARPGINALLRVANRNSARLVASDLGFAIGPRLNAAGRLDDMSLGINCLLAVDDTRAAELAQNLDDLNRERREIQSDMQLQALDILQALPNDSDDMPVALALYDETWHQGVIGILAGRIKDKYHRPVIAFAKGKENELKGSARSITGLHIRDVLEQVDSRHPGMIIKFGGHAMAAGLSLKADCFETFSASLIDVVAELVTPEQLQGKILSDGELGAEELTVDFAELLRNAAPWGQSFPEPVFDDYFEILEQRIVGGKHLKLTLMHEKTQCPINAIYFNIDEHEWPNHRAIKVHAAFRLDVNEYQGLRSVQLMIEHLQIVG